ncbi:MAG: hypothetical protein B1H11_01700 [Desulfobacteraceae bacterium 4484_190.1]|nr:MAG: hypothetical protein B1H11_01700 [Desulfobacteraceae bacterium 4484_190.1]
MVTNKIRLNLFKIQYQPVTTLKGAALGTIPGYRCQGENIMASIMTLRKIRYLQNKKGGYFQTCIALQGLPKKYLFYQYGR